jgi:hypothetical protein
VQKPKTINFEVRSMEA